MNINDIPAPNRITHDPDIDCLPITEHGTYDDSPIEDLDFSTLKRYISQMRARYRAANSNDPLRPYLDDMHRELMTEYRVRLPK